MTGDEARNKLYSEAIDSLAPSKIVADLGTGAHALWAIRAARAGAKRVFAIESDQHAFELAKQSIAQAGLESKITLLHGTAPDVVLPVKVDLLISEFIGEIVSSEGMAPILSSAARSYLHPDGRMIPYECETKAVVAELCPELRNNPCFDERAIPYIKQIWESANCPFDLRLTLESQTSVFRPLSEEFSLERFKFDSPHSPKIPHRTTFSTRITEPSKADGLVAWIEFRCLGSQEPVRSLVETHWTPTFMPFKNGAITVDSSMVVDGAWSSFFRTSPVRPDFELGLTIKDSLDERPIYNSVYDLPFLGSVFGQTKLHRSLAALTNPQS